MTSTIPSWATKVVKAKEQEFLTSTRQSANLFRIECARTWQQRIHYAQKKAWSTTIQSALERKNNKDNINNSNSSNNDTNSQRTPASTPTRKRQREEIIDQDSSKFPSKTLMEYYTIDPRASIQLQQNYPHNATLSIKTNKDDLNASRDDKVSAIEDTTKQHGQELSSSLLLQIISPPPSCRLDRQAMAEAIWDEYRQRHPRCAPLWLPRILPTLHDTMHLLARQCFQLEDIQSQQLGLSFFRKRAKKRNASMQQLLLWWADRTTLYDSMIIIVEDPGSFAQGQVWQQFIKVIHGWYINQGLPVSLLVIDSTSRAAHQSLVLALSGPMTSIHIQYIQPSYNTWLSTFWKELAFPTEDQQQHPIGSASPPFPFSDMQELSSILHDYRMYHHSLTKLCQSLCRSITTFYSTSHHAGNVEVAYPIVWDGMAIHPSFLSWLAIHGTAKKWLSPQNGASKYVSFQECLRLQGPQCMGWWWNWLVHIMPILMNPVPFAKSFSIANERERILQALNNLYVSLEGNSVDDEIPSNKMDGKIEADTLVPPLPDMERYLDRVQARKDKLKSGVLSRKVKEWRRKQRAQSLLFEIIVMLGNTTTSNMAATKLDSNDFDPAKHNTSKSVESNLSLKQKHDGLSRMLHELMDWCLESLQELLCDWKAANPLCKATRTKGTSTTTAITAYHPIRQDIVAGLESPTRELYGLMQDRLSIPRDEWFYQFGGSPLDFVQGVWELVLLGLVQQKSKRSGPHGTIISYEKVSVVWC